MHYKTLSVLLLVCVFTVSGCGTAATPASTTQPAVVEDQASFLAALRASNIIVKTGESITQDFFSPDGHIITINGQDVQVFEYESAEAMENEASKVAPDGGSVGTSMMSWMDAPHFYKAGRILVLYVGSDKSILDVLEKAIGRQFAGG
jgi:hypothetical protein